MKKYILLLSILLLTISTNLFAYSPYTAPLNGTYVLDKTGKLSQDQIDSLNVKIENLNTTTHNEFGILLIPDMGGDSIEDVAYDTFRSWGIGKKGLDNGCLIVVSLKERRSRIETGKGVGGEITDLQANDILNKNLNPHLKKGEFYEGFNDTLDALSALMIAHKSGASKTVSIDNDGVTKTLIYTFIVGIPLLIIVFAIFLKRSKSSRLRSYSSSSSSYDYSESTSYSSYDSSSSYSSDSGFGGGDSGGGGSSSNF